MKNVQQAHLATSKEQRDHGEEKSADAEERVGVLGVPNELLDIILGYAPDLETRFAAAQTSHQFCESIERLSPRLEHQLVRRRFPLLAALDAGGSTQRPTEPRDLFITYSRFFDDRLVIIARGNQPEDRGAPPFPHPHGHGVRAGHEICAQRPPGAIP